MLVDGYVRMSVSLNVINLETDSVEIGRYGKPVITNPDQFFEDWVDAWCSGVGELTGASDESVDLEVIEDEE